MDNLLNVDEDMLRAYFVDAQDKVVHFNKIINNQQQFNKIVEMTMIIDIKANQSTRKPKVDIRELHEAYQVIATLIRQSCCQMLNNKTINMIFRRNRMMIMNGHEEEQGQWCTAQHNERHKLQLVVLKFIFTILQYNSQCCSMANVAIKFTQKYNEVQKTSQN